MPISLVPMYMSGQMTDRAAKSTRFPIMCLRNSPSFFSNSFENRKEQLKPGSMENQMDSCNDECHENAHVLITNSSLFSYSISFCFLIEIPLATHLTNTRVFFCYQLVHVTIKHNVDMALETYPSVVQLICNALSWYRCQHRTVQRFTIPSCLLQNQKLET